MTLGVTVHVCQYLVADSGCVAGLGTCLVWVLCLFRFDKVSLRIRKHTHLSFSKRWVRDTSTRGNYTAMYTGSPLISPGVFDKKFRASWAHFTLFLQVFISIYPASSKTCKKNLGLLSAVGKNSWCHMTSSSFVNASILNSLEWAATAHNNCQGKSWTNTWWKALGNYLNLHDVALGKSISEEGVALQFYPTSASLHCYAFVKLCDYGIMWQPTSATFL